MVRDACKIMGITCEPEGLEVLSRAMDPVWGMQVG